MASSSASPSASHLAVVCAVESLTAVPESDHLAVAVLHVATASGESQERRVVVKRSELQPGELCVFVAAGSFVLRHKAFSKAADNFYQVLRKRIAGVQSEGMVLSLSVLEDASIQSASSVGFPAFEDSEARKPDEVKAGTDVSEWLRVRERLALGAGDLGAVVELVEQELAGSTYLLERAGRMCGEVLERMKGGEAAEWEDGTAERLGRVVELHGRLPKYLQRRLCKAALRLLGRAGDRAVPVLDRILSNMIRNRDASFLLNISKTVQFIFLGTVLRDKDISEKIRARKTSLRSEGIGESLQSLLEIFVGYDFVSCSSVLHAIAAVTPLKDTPGPQFAQNVRLLIKKVSDFPHHLGERGMELVTALDGVDLIFSHENVENFNWVINMSFLAPMWQFSPGSYDFALKLLNHVGWRAYFPITYLPAYRPGGNGFNIGCVAFLCSNARSTLSDYVAERLRSLESSPEVLVNKMMTPPYSQIWNLCILVIAAPSLPLDVGLLESHVEAIVGRRLELSECKSERAFQLMLRNNQDFFQEKMIKSAAKLS